MTWGRQLIPLLALALWAVGAAPARAECYGALDVVQEATPIIPELGVSIRLRPNSGRMAAPVLVNGRGPYPFIVDTGANRSVVSRQLAAQMNAPSVGVGEVHSIEGVAEAPLVQMESISLGHMTLPSASMPVLNSAVMGGGQGLLGVDGMIGRRLFMDFDERCLEIQSASAPRQMGYGWVTLRGTLRFGHLIVIRGHVRNHSINILIDTGSDSSLANPALQQDLRRFIRRDDNLAASARAYTAGTPIVLSTAVIIPRIEMAGVSVENVVAYVGDYHIFDLWGLRDEPTLLVGMDVLSQSRAMMIDYSRQTVYFRLRPSVRTGSRIPMEQVQ